MISIFSLSLIFVLQKKDRLTDVEPIVAYPFSQTNKKKDELIFIFIEISLINNQYGIDGVGNTVSHTDIRFDSISHGVGVPRAHDQRASDGEI